MLCLDRLLLSLMFGFLKRWHNLQLSLLKLFRLINDAFLFAHIAVILAAQREFVLCVLTHDIIHYSSFLLGLSTDGWNRHAVEGFLLNSWGRHIM